MKASGKWAILSGVMLAMLLSSLDQTIVATAMPRIVQDLNGLEHFSWVFTAYMLGSTVTVPIYGKLSDMFGRRNLYLLGIVIFLAASALCGISQDMTQLIMFRAVQGIGGGAMMVNSFAIIGQVFPPAERGRYQGLIGGVFGLSSVAGPLAGGWITDHVSWRWVFYVNLPVGIIALVVLSAALPRIARVNQDRRIDYTGAFLIAATLIPLLLSLVWGGSMYGWTSWPIIACGILCITSLALFIRTEKNAVNPILAPSLFRNRVFVTAVGALFLTTMGMFGAIVYIPVFSQGIIGGSATHAGLILTPMMLSLVIASTLSGRLISRTGRYRWISITGTLIITTGLFWFSTIDTDTTNGELVARMIVLGIGLGSTMPVYTLAVQSAFPAERLGEVTAGSQLFRNVGGTVGTAILGGIMNIRLASAVENMQTDPIVQTLQNPGNAPGNRPADGSILQSVLNPAYQQQLRASLERSGNRQSLPALDHFIDSARSAFSRAVDDVFLVATGMMILAVLCAFFLPEIPLRTAAPAKSFESTGMELEEELGQSDAEHQPKQTVKSH